MPVARSRNFADASPNFADVTGKITGAVQDFILDPWPPGPRDRGYCATDEGIWKTTKLDELVPAWSQVLTAASFATATGKTLDRIANLRGSINQRNLFYCQAVSTDNNVYVGRSTNACVSWTWSATLGTVLENAVLGFDISKHLANKVYSAGGGALKRCTNGLSGLTFSALAGWSGGDPTTVYVPYADNDDDDVIFAGDATLVPNYEFITPGPSYPVYIDGWAQYLSAVIAGGFTWEWSASGGRTEPGCVNMVLGTPSSVFTQGIGIRLFGLSVVVSEGDTVTAYFTKQSETLVGASPYVYAVIEVVYSDASTTKVTSNPTLGGGYTALTLTVPLAKDGFTIATVRLYWEGGGGTPSGGGRIDDVSFSWDPAYDASFLRSLNGGTSFADITPGGKAPRGRRGIACSDVDRTIMAALVSDDGVMFDLVTSDDGGDTWTTRQTGLTNAADIGVNGNTGEQLLFIADGHIYYSGDSGDTLEDKLGDWVAVMGGALVDGRRQGIVWTVT